MVRPQDDEGTEVDSPLMAFLGDYRAHQVGTDAVKKYIAQRLKAGAANATVNRELAALKRIFLTWDPSRKDSPKALYSDARRDNVRPAFSSTATYRFFGCPSGSPKAGRHLRLLHRLAPGQNSQSHIGASGRIKTAESLSSRNGR